MSSLSNRPVCTQAWATRTSKKPMLCSLGTLCSALNPVGAFFSPHFWMFSQSKSQPWNTILNKHPTDSPKVSSVHINNANNNFYVVQPFSKERWRAFFFYLQNITHYTYSKSIILEFRTSKYRMTEWLWQTNQTLRWWLKKQKAAIGGFGKTEWWQHQGEGMWEIARNTRNSGS